MGLRQMRGCPFCERLAEDATVVSRGTVSAFPDAYPVSTGHTLVVPRRHETDFLRLSDDEAADMWALAREVCARLRDEHGARAFNIGINAGKEAGQTVDHVHLHVIPRYEGDVEDPRGGIRSVVPRQARYWEQR